jgi:hypothetical protein
MAPGRVAGSTFLLLVAKLVKDCDLLNPPLNDFSDVSNILLLP